MKTLIADKFSEAHILSLNQLGCEVTYKPGAKAEELPGLIAPFKILVVRGKQVTGETLKAADQLALVLRAGAGVNTIDVKTASTRGVFVSNCPGKNSIAVAELVFALLLAIDRRIPENTAALRAHKWNKKEFSKADGVFGKTLGVIGVGQIGREVIRRAQAFGLRTIAWARSLTPEKAEELGVERCASVDDVFRQADIVITAPGAQAGHAQAGQRGPAGAAEAERHSHQHRPRRGGGPSRAARRAPGGQAARGPGRV